MRKLLVLMMLFLWVTFIFAADLMVVGEVFSTTTCPSCPGARSALYSFYQNHPDRAIPLIWNTSEGGYANYRYTIYPHPDGNYVPYYAVGGDHAETGGHSVSDFESVYNNIVNNPSPISIALDYSVSGSSVTINANVSLESDLTPDAGASVEYFIALTNHTPTAGDYRGKVIAFSGYNDFPLRTSGDNATYTFTASAGSVSPLNTHAVMVIQERGSTYLQTIFQGASVPVQPFDAVFGSDITTGAPELNVQFTNLSTGPNMSNMSYRWNFGEVWFC